MGDFTHVAPRPGVLTLSGELTVSGAAELRELFLRVITENETVEVDLLNVTRIDTAGVQLLILLRREAAARGKTLRLLGYSLAVEEALELLDLMRTFGQPAAVVWS